ncbi:MAG: hypothetical protein SFU25_03210 [Candidatus Caenarcaniphilales bacterium]|nr:hypothetical protein [Candidatus Caenarcaniphilales bacterium]
MKLKQEYVISCGNSKFTHFQMLDSKVTVLDANPKNPFHLYLLNYAKNLPSSKIEYQPDKSLVVTFPDAKV